MTFFPAAGRNAARDSSDDCRCGMEEIMKKGCCALLAAALLMLAAGALAQTLPSVECFSPGLLAMSEAVASGAPVHLEASLDADSALYARDLSVLSAMLDGTTIACDSSPDTDSLRIERQDETLFSLAVTRGEDAAAVAIGDSVFRVADEQALLCALLGDEAGAGGASAMIGALAPLTGAAILERVPLSSVAQWFESLETGVALDGGFAVTQAFTVERTMSDDGTRLTRIDVTGALAREGETPWTLSGWLRQPAGRTPKDTFELTLTQDEDNYFELAYSSTRQSNVTRKDKAGENKVDTTLRAAGELAGSKISSRLTVCLRNNWTADGESLTEKVVVNSTLTHEDKTPGRRMQRLNLVEASLRNAMQFTTWEGDDSFSVTDSVTCTVEMDSNTFLEGSAALTLTVGGEALPGVGPAPQSEAAPEEIQKAAQEAVAKLAAKLYAQLGEDTKEKIAAGLPQNE